MDASDHDAIIQLTSAVSYLTEEVRTLRTFVDAYGSTLNDIKMTLARNGINGNDRNCFKLSKSLAYTIAVVVVLALGGAITLDCDKALRVMSVAKTVVPVK